MTTAQDNTNDMMTFTKPQTINGQTSPMTWTLKRDPKDVAERQGTKIVVATFANDCITGLVMIPGSREPGEQSMSRQLEKWGFRRDTAVCAARRQPKQILASKQWAHQPEPATVPRQGRRAAIMPTIFNSITEATVVTAAIATSDPMVNDDMVEGGYLFLKSTRNSEAQSRLVPAC